MTPEFDREAVEIAMQRIRDGLLENGRDDYLDQTVSQLNALLDQAPSDTVRDLMTEACFGAPRGGAQRMELPANGTPSRYELSYNNSTREMQLRPVAATVDTAPAQPEVAAVHPQDAEPIMERLRTAIGMGHDGEEALRALNDLLNRAENDTVRDQITAVCFGAPNGGTQRMELEDNSVPPSRFELSYNNSTRQMTLRGMNPSTSAEERSESPEQRQTPPAADIRQNLQARREELQRYRTRLLEIATGVGQLTEQQGKLNRELNDPMRPPTQERSAVINRLLAQITKGLADLDERRRALDADITRTAAQIDAMGRAPEQNESPERGQAREWLSRVATRAQNRYGSRLGELRFVSPDVLTIRKGEYSLTYTIREEAGAVHIDAATTRPVEGPRLETTLWSAIRDDTHILGSGPMDFPGQSFADYYWSGRVANWINAIESASEPPAPEPAPEPAPAQVVTYSEPQAVMERRQPVRELISRLPIIRRFGRR